MAAVRKPLFERTTALLAGPFLLGQRALSLMFLPGKEPPPGPPPGETTLRIPVTAPDHAIKRRG